MALADTAQLLIHLRMKDEALGPVEKLKKGLGGLTGVAIATGAAIGTLGIAGLRMGDDYHDAMETIRTGTGKTGDALAGLEQSFKNVGGQTEHSLALISTVMADLNTRTGLTGQALEGMTQRVLDFSDVTGSDAVSNVAGLTRVFGDWSIATDDQAATMDKLMRASQASGIEMDSLMQTVVQFGAPLRLLGFEFEESIAMLAKWEKEGVNVETALTGMKFSLKTLASEGVPASEFAVTLRQRFDDIKNSADPVGESIKLFGLRAGPDLAAAIVEGRFATEDMLDVIKNGSDTVDQAAKDTEKFGDAFGKLKNQVTLAIGPIMDDFAGLADEMGNAIYLLPALGGAIGGVTAKLWLKVAALAAAKGGWLSMIGAMGPFAAVAGAVAGGIFLINEGFNEANKHGEKAVGILNDMSAAQKELAANTQTAGGSVGELTNHIANVIGLIAPWHELAPTSREISDELNGVADSAAEVKPALESIPWAESSHAMNEVATTATQAAQATTLAWQGSSHEINETFSNQLPQMVATTRQMVTDVAGTLRSNKGTVRDAMQDLVWVMTHPLKGAKEIARIEGALTGDRLANGLASKDPFIRQQAQTTKNILISQWESLTGKAYNEGVDAANAMERGLRTFNPGFWKLPRIGGGGGTSGGRQHGGLVMAGRGYVVGERRPEWFEPNVSGRVHPTIPRGGIARHIEPQPINVNIRTSFHVSVREIASEAQRYNRLAPARS